MGTNKLLHKVKLKDGLRKVDLSITKLYLNY